MKQNTINIILSFVAIINLLLVSLLFWMVTGSNDNRINVVSGNKDVSSVINDETPLNITVYDDKRCVECDTNSVVSQIESDLPNANINVVDFSDEWVEEDLKNKGIKFLPYVVFDKWNVNSDIDKYLEKLPDNTYWLFIWGKFPSFPLDLEKVKTEIYSNSTFKGPESAKITWIEYSDLECPFCAQFSNSGITDILLDRYPNDLNKTMNHFPLNFHANALPAAQALEYVSEKEWSDSFYNIISKSFEKYNNNNFDMEGFYDIIVSETNLSKEEVKKAVNSNQYAEKVNKQMSLWREMFEITWTPWNVIINNETGEYRIISGAVPTATLDLIIQDLLK